MKSEEIMSFSVSMSLTTLSYGERAKRHSNPAAKALLETIERKKSNLCVSVDVTSSSEFLSVIDVVGPYASLIKVSHVPTLWSPGLSDFIQTHVDIIEDFDPSLIEKLNDLSTKHDFLIFEDRKFADIGS